MVRGFVHYFFVRGNLARESGLTQSREVAKGERRWGMAIFDCLKAWPLCALSEAGVRSPTLSRECSRV